jgi:uncharacterized membrane protein
VKQNQTANKDNRMETTIGNLLLTGVIAAGSVVLIGAVLFLIRHGFEIPSYRIFKPDVFNLSDFKDMFRGIAHFRSASIMELGILMLIATPMLRVLFSVVAFAAEKDYLYTLFALIVLFVLVYSFFS